MSKALSIFAGKTALAQIKEQGINQQQFKLLVGASGGPKWFVLAGLDRFFCGEFFKQRPDPLYTLGSSAGAWRFSCYGQQQPLAAINRLIEGYSTLTYAKDANIKQVSESSEQLLTHILGSDGIDQIVNNKVFKTNIVVAKSKGLTRYENKALLLSGLVSSAVSNRINRAKLGRHYQRVVMSTEPQYIPFDHNDGIDTQIAPLTQQNGLMGLLATGSIPMVVHGIKDIPGVGEGMYRDGGIVDYHFNQRFLPTSSNVDLEQQKLVLYPHFYNEFKPGWFDKYIKQRFSNPKHFDNVVVLAPTEAFVNSLPNQKIPDRKDFLEMPDDIRIAYWHKVIAESERLADEFNEICHHSDPSKYINLIE